MKLCPRLNHSCTFKKNFFFNLNFLGGGGHVPKLCGILVPWPGIEPAFLSLEAWSHNCWITRESLIPAHFKNCLLAAVHLDWLSTTCNWKNTWLFLAIFFNFYFFLRVKKMWIWSLANFAVFWKYIETGEFSRSEFPDPWASNHVSPFPKILPEWSL